MILNSKLIKIFIFYIKIQIPAPNIFCFTLWILVVNLDRWHDII